jgi:hypothetical protein
MSFQSMRLKIISGTTGSAERRFSSWIGGSILASLVSIMCISHFWDRPVPIFTDVRFSYLALVQDKKIMCVLLANACCIVYGITHFNCIKVKHQDPMRQIQTGRLNKYNCYLYNNIYQTTLYRITTEVIFSTNQSTNNLAFLEVSCCRIYHYTM